MGKRKNRKNAFLPFTGGSGKKKIKKEKFLKIFGATAIQYILKTINLIDLKNGIVFLVAFKSLKFIIKNANKVHKDDI